LSIPDECTQGSGIPFANVTQQFCTAECTSQRCMQRGSLRAKCRKECVQFPTPAECKNFASAGGAPQVRALQQPVMTPQGMSPQ
jgi:hypothetical protein